VELRGRHARRPGRGGHARALHPAQPDLTAVSGSAHHAAARGRGDQNAPQRSMLGLYTEGVGRLDKKMYTETHAFVAGRPNPRPWACSSSPAVW
jgi:hypothetical protein